ncbi:PTS sugar transporter subunit IIA [Alteribacillus sp. YIM 98480]|uniref:PTS sugar transporter subunit IIA n=1 Tax=Alteribacillus sp. YIM 98480 TaxID=2606599 RepID=UPI00131D6DBC|nr:hypothetical protein [Alteribacillus sp. YIM 98480]
MRHFIFATHGHLSEAMMYSVEMILGKKDNLDYITMEPETSIQDIKKSFVKIIEKKPLKTDCIVLTDILGGSITNVMAEFITQKGVYLVTGINLPMVIELMSGSEWISTEELIENSVAQGKNGIVYINHALKNQ